MSNLNMIEKEAKFYIRNLKKVEATIEKMGGKVAQPRTFESNLRFDTPDRTLSASYQVLRLRSDTRARLTYKGPADLTSTVSARPEYEVEISDLETGVKILEALGYEIITIYEKYRTSYDLDGAEISLDEMPFGCFMEIEGEDEAQIERIAESIGLKWDKRTSLSYLRLFDNVKQRLDLSLRDLTFTNFSGLEIQPVDLQLAYAD